MSPVRVLIVDDSPTIRRLLVAVLSRDPEIEVVGTASEPAVARQMIRELNPQVVTLDIEMPNMTGLQFLEKIMRLRPMPVVMISTLTDRGTQATLEALELGAVDYFPKPTDGQALLSEAVGVEIAKKVKAAAHAQVQARVPQAERPAPPATYAPGKKIVAVGSSTGGVEALQQMLSCFPANCPPTVIVQHMPAHFTKSFADRLDRTCQPRVLEAQEGAVLEIGTVYLAPGGIAHLEVVKQGGLRCHLQEGDAVSGHRPSVDVLFRSVGRYTGAGAVGVILTGMGRDGAAGLRAMRDAGADTIGQDEASCVVYGMPRAAFDAGAVGRQLPLNQIGPAVLNLCAA